MADEFYHNRRATDRFQEQLDTRAIELASQALHTANAPDRTCEQRFQLLRDDLGDMKSQRQEQHKFAEDKFTSIARAQWSAAVSCMLLLLSWVFYLATHQH